MVAVKDARKGKSGSLGRSYTHCYVCDSDNQQGPAGWHREALLGDVGSLDERGVGWGRNGCLHTYG